MNNILKHFIKSFCWYVVGLSVIIAIVLGIGVLLDIDLTSRSFIIYTCVIGVCSVMCFFSFLTHGRANGKEDKDYKVNLELYIEKRSGRGRGEMSDFLKFSECRDRDIYISEAADALNMTEAGIRSIKKFKRGEYTYYRRRQIRNIQRKKYPCTYPRNPNVILNILDKGSRYNKRLDVNADIHFLWRKSAQKITITLIMTIFACSIVASIATSNVVEAIIRICLSLISIGFSIFFGYKDGYYSSTPIEKNILGKVIRLFDEMDEWKKSHNI